MTTSRVVSETRRALLASASLLLALTSCDSPAEPPDPVIPPGPDPDAVVASLELHGPTTLQVNERGLFTVTARNARGDVIEPPWPPLFTAEDTTVLSMSYGGTARGVGLGRTTVRVSVADVSATASTEVWARARIVPEYPVWGQSWRMAVGDTLQLGLAYIDYDGHPIEDAAGTTPTWTSSDPSAVSVTQSGLVTGLEPNSSAVIRASAANTIAETTVWVLDVVAGEPAGVRFAHAARGLGPVTFLPSQGDPVVLSYGESVEVPILSGLYYVRTQGLPDGGSPYARPFEYAAVIEGGQHLSFFGVGDPSQGFLAAGWDIHEPIAGGTGLVRLVQGWADVGIYYLRPPGSPMEGLPELCYFDPGDVSTYFARDAGDFDLILQAKLADNYEDGAAYELDRFGSTVADGSAVTLVVAGSRSQGFEILTFPDP